MINFGKRRPGSTLYVPFETFAGSTGAPITMTGLAISDVTKVKIYKNGGTTEQASPASLALLDTDGIDFDGLTGIHGFSVNLADNTTANFYTCGGEYFIVVTGLTVDGQTVRFIAATFSIGYEGSMIDTTIATLASQTSFTLATGPAEDDALNGCVLVIHDIASAVQVAQPIVLDYTGSTKTVTLAAAPTFTIAQYDNVSVMPRTNLYAVNGTPASVAGTVDANVVSFSSTADTDITEVLDRLGYLLARSAGAVADAQTTAPAYAITRSGDTFTVTLAGVTSAGVRTAPTLGKT